MISFVIAWFLPMSGYSLQLSVDYDFCVFGYESSGIHFDFLTDADGEEVAVDIWDETETIDFNIINSVPKQVEGVFYKFSHDESGNTIQTEVARRTYNVTTIGYYQSGKTQVIVIPDFIKRIGRNAFASNTNITKLIIPETLKEIGEGAFSNTSITELIIPETLMEIGESAFSHCENLSFVSIKANDNLKCGAYPFMGSFQLETVVFEEGTKIIPNSICQHCEGLKNLTLPSSLRKIGFDAFSDCTSIEEIELPDGLEEIDDAAFDGDERLKEITLPNSLTKIGHQAFSRCSGLTKVISLIQEPFDVDVTAFWDDAVCQEYWYGKYIKVTNADLYVPAGTKKKYEDFGLIKAWTAFNSIIEMEDSSEQTIKGDVNSDGKVSAADVVSIIIIIGSEGKNMKGDINGDGKVDIADVAAVCGIIFAE